MFRRDLLALLLASVSLPAFARVPPGLMAPELRIAGGGPKNPRIALTLDACMGDTDMRIVGTLIDERVPATIFVTGRWLARNADALKLMLAHPDLFELENHGAMHVPAITTSHPLYGIRTAGSIPAVIAEVKGGAAAMAAHGLPAPVWYRDATALYTVDALTIIRAMGFRIAGFSLNADYGASIPAEAVVRRMHEARDGDVLIGHVNQPRRSSGAGISEGIKALKSKGFTFARLRDVPEIDAWGEDGPKGNVLLPATQI